MKLTKIFIAATALFAIGCGSEPKTTNENISTNDLVEVSEAQLPKAVILVTNQETKEVRAFELDQDFSQSQLTDLSEDAKKAFTESLQGREISTKPNGNAFAIDVNNFDLPAKNTVNWFYGRYRGFYGYGFGYRFPYSYGYGFGYRGYLYGYYRPYYGYGFGYRYPTYYW